MEIDFSLQGVTRSLLAKFHENPKFQGFPVIFLRFQPIETSWNLGRAGGGVAVLQQQAAGRERRGCARLTGGTGRPRDPAGSDGVRGERDRARRR
jgi:hypothetical protein